MNKKCFTVKTGHLGRFYGLSGVYVRSFRLVYAGSGLNIYYVILGLYTYY